MKENDDKDLEKIEKEIKKQFDAVEIQSEEEFLSKVRPRLKKKRKKRQLRPRTMVTRTVVAAASLILILGIGFTIWHLLKEPEVPQYRYLDLDIEIALCEQNDITNYEGLYVPNLELLTLNVKYSVGNHRESKEVVYFVIEGLSFENEIMRNVTLTIILQKKYEIVEEEMYTLGDKLTVSGIELFYIKEDYVEPFYSYKIGFKIGDMRYYMDYQTTSSENDIESFLQLFLK